MGINRSKIARQLLQRGGTTGFEGSPEMGGRGTTETYGFDQSDSSDNVRAERRKEIAKGLGKSAVELTAKTAFPQLYYGYQAAKGLDKFLKATGLVDPNVKVKGPGPNMEDDNSIPVMPLVSPAVGIASQMEEQPSELAEYIASIRAAQPNPFMLDPRFAAADGGRVAFGLGSLVRKITKPIKKLAKSKVGKAALTAAGIYGLGKMTGGSSLTGGPFSRIKKFLLGSSSAAGERGIVKSPGLLQKLFLKKGETDFSLGALDPLKVAGIAATASPFLLTPDQEDEETVDQAMARLYGREGGIDIPGIRRAALGYSDPNELYFKLPEAFRLRAAEGGTIDDEYFARKDKELEKLIEEGMSLEEALQKVFPGTKSSVEFTREELGLEPLPEGKAEGGIMDLDGKEMDLRGGGFVPIGAKEKADDVPARLSKNEFVFTADAVRGAGGGSVEKGAQKMYNTMKQLEEMV